MKYLKSFNSLLESTSAGSHDRGSSLVSPFKYSKNFDPRLGYSKEDFIKDVIQIYKSYKLKDRRELMDFIFKNSGVLRISNISNLSQEKVDELIKSLENFLDSKAEYKPSILPDGYVLCYENVFHNRRRCDVYYSPELKLVKISFTDSYPETEEIIYKLEEFSPDSYGIGSKDFLGFLTRFDS